MYRQPPIIFLLLTLLAAACGGPDKIELTPAPALPATAEPSVVSHTAIPTATSAESTATRPATISTAPPAESGEVTPAPTAGNLQTYRNTTAGFELDFPASWLVDTTGISNGVILRSQKAEGPGTDGVPADVVKMDIVIPYVTVRSLDELVAWEKQGIADSGHAVLEEQQLQLPSGLRVVRMRLEGALALLAVVNGWPVIIAGYGDLSRFDNVARTLRGYYRKPIGVVYVDGKGLTQVADGAFLPLAKGGH